MTETCMTDYLANKVETAAKRARAARTAGIILAAAGCIGGTALSPIIYALIPLSVVLVCLASRLESSWRWGMEGEERLRRRLRQILDDRSALFYGIPVSSGDVDCLVVAPHGIWAIEGKFYSGEISCADGHHWCRLRNRDGEVYPEAIGNPVSQLARGIMDLKAYFASHGIKTWIHGMVVFTNPRAILDVTGLTNISVVTLSSLTALPGGPELPDQTRKAVIRALMELKARAAARRHCA